jgi:oligopeptide transport system ATP-binding protein
MNLLRQLQDDLGLTYLFIAHDLAAVAHMSDRVAVMTSGEIVETGPAAEIYSRPQHEYTRTLLAAIPADTPRKPGAAARTPITEHPPEPPEPTA